MENNTVFHYQYSAKESAEIQDIRKKYLPQQESKLAELKRLDRTVQNAGVATALCIGTISTLIFGAGMCHAMQVLGSGLVAQAAGIALGLAGMAGMLTAYSLHRKLHAARKAKLAPRILELANELGCN